MAYTTAQLVAQYKEARDNIADLIVSITASPKPSYSIDGETVQWGDYLAKLRAQVAELEAMIAQKDPGFHQTQYFT